MRWGAGLGTAASSACSAAWPSCVSTSCWISSALPQPCLSLSTPTRAHSSGQSMKATATDTSPSTKPGLKPTSIVPSSPLASDQPSWPPSTGEVCRNGSSHADTAWGGRKLGTKSHSHSTASVSAADSRSSLLSPLQPSQVWCSGHTKAI